MNSRLKEIRLKLRLSQKKFGDKMFLSQDQISLLENGKRNITDRTLNDICRTFNVNEEWLKYGHGEMFIDPVANIDASEDVRELVKKILSLSEEDRRTIEDLISKKENVK
jgi:hypothetical protein cdifQCD-_18829